MTVKKLLQGVIFTVITLTTIILSLLLGYVVGVTESDTACTENEVTSTDEKGGDANAAGSQHELRVLPVQEDNVITPRPEADALRRGFSSMHDFMLSRPGFVTFHDCEPAAGKCVQTTAATESGRPVQFHFEHDGERWRQAASIQED